MQKRSNKKSNLRFDGKIKKKYNKKNRQKFFYLKHLKRNLRKRIKNEELYKIPKFINYYFSLKMWKKPKLNVWRYFLTFRHKYFNKYYAKSMEWKNFKYLKKELYFWFQRRTKRQLYILKKKFILLNKGNKRKNYFNLKMKYFNNNYEIKKKKYFFFFNKLNFKYFFFFFICIFKLLLKRVLIISKFNKFNFFIIFYLLNNYLKRLSFYLKKNLRKKYVFIDFMDLKELKYIRSKWVQRIKKKRKKFIYENSKLEKKAKFFFNLKRKIFFFLNLPNLTNQFYYLKIKTVDTNFYITLTNSKHEVIIYRSTGHVSENRKKKIKLSPFTINNMIYDIIGRIKNIKMKYVIVHINSRINKNIKNVFRTIGNSVNTKLIKAEFSKPIPHHFGTRKSKPRRL